MTTAEDIVKKKGGHIISVTADTTIHKALETMISSKVGAMLIMEEDKIVGIWTERDLMRNTVVQGFDPKSAIIGKYMVTGLQSCPHTDTVYQLMDRLLGLGLRHLLVEKDGDYIGVLSTRDVIKACLQEKTQELKDLNAMVSWEYYENWKPTPPEDRP